MMRGLLICSILRNGFRGPPGPRSSNASETRRFSMDLRLKTYIVEDNATIRENLIGTLEELACIKAIGWAETETKPVPG